MYTHQKMPIAWMYFARKAAVPTKLTMTGTMIGAVESGIFLKNNCRVMHEH